MRRSHEYRRGQLIVGLVAAAALTVKGILDWHYHSGWPMLIGAAGILVALALRNFVYRD